MLFAETLATLGPRGPDFAAQIGPDWGQGRATFGGMVAALGHEAMHRVVPADRPLRALSVVFVGPTDAGAVHIRTEVLRSGKAATIAQALVVSGGQTAASLIGVYGSARPSGIAVPARSPVRVPPAEQVADVPLPAGFRRPAFLEHFALRWAEGAVPFTGTSLSHSKAYMHHLDDAPLTESHVIALIDVIPTPVLQMMTTPAPSSSLTWSLEIVDHDLAFAADAWWRIDTEIDSAADGYVSQTSILVNPAGATAALSRQLVTVFG